MQNTSKDNKNTPKSAGGQSSIATLSQERATKSNAIEVPQISLPKGGGAIKGIDEKFQVNAANGTSSFSIPLPLSPNRNGFTPQLSLSYNSGVGNGLFGLGWDLDLPAIQRRTDKKLPRYRDTHDLNAIQEEDSFMFSGVEELVPFMDFKAGAWVVRQEIIDEFTIRQYRPRIEGAFSRIERIWHKDHDYYWRVTTSNNITTFFGYSESCRIADPAEKSRVFQWLPEFSYDDKGSWIWYEYKQEDLRAVNNVVHEKNRIARIAPFSNRHIKHIRYGNEAAKYFDASPFAPLLPAKTEDYFFELVFDYGEHHDAVPTPSDNGSWKSRADAFSDYRAGFEIRTYRLCKRVLMYHRFAALGEEPVLVRSLDFKYAHSTLYASDLQSEQEAAEVTYLTEIQQTGYVKNGAGYSRKSLPKMTFEYQKLVWHTDVKTVTNENLINTPSGLAGNYQWVDLYNEGINGILSEQANGWFYKHNLGEVAQKGTLQLGPNQPVMPKPSFNGISNGVLQLQDLDADGGKQIVVTSEGTQGFFELNDQGHWEPFRAFAKRLNLDLRDPNVRMLDINGDGKPEVVLSDVGAFWFWENQGKMGYDTPELATKPYDEERGAAIVFDDYEQRIFLADMSGDGLTDIVRIRNGEVCYWPNLGYGRFGAKVTMNNAPWFDASDMFNPAYLQLADISGTGATDLIYLGKNKFKAWLNLSGNAWSEATEIEHFFPTEQPNQITVTDLLGNGTACIVWSSEMPAYQNAPMRYIDLMGGNKPHLLRSHQNGLGKMTEVEYKSSTHFYLQDKLAGTPWITKLPFPVHVVAKTTVTERVSNLRFSAEYSYHHGYYDHAEREFRGFGRVEQIDTEAFDVFENLNQGDAIPPEHYQPPVLTKTWFHTGAFFNKERILSQFKTEYWQEAYKKKGFTTSAVEHELPDAVLLPANNLTGFDMQQLSAVEWQEALRACKGMTLRQEVFGRDAEKLIADEKKAKSYTDNDPAFLQFQADAKRTEQLPYSVATHNCEIQLLQERGANRYGVYMVKESEAISYAYERNPEDPRIAHTLTIETDELGNVLEAVSVVYPRLQEEGLLKEVADDLDEVKTAKKYGRTAQQKQWITLTKNEVTNDIITPANFYLRKGWQTQTWELTGLQPANGFLFKISDFKGVFNSLPEIAYQTAPKDDLPQKRLIEHVKTKFYNAEMTASLPDGEQAIRGIPFEAYQLAYTPGLIADIFKPSAHSTQFTVTDQDMEAGRFLKDAGNWWIQSGTVHFRRNGETDLEFVKKRFFAPVAYTDPYDSVTQVFYDDLHLYMKSSKDELGNENKIARYNYRTLSPDIMLDLNNNRSSVMVDELGMVKAVSVEGKVVLVEGKEGEADNLDGFHEMTDAAETTLIAAFFAKAKVAAPEICDSDGLQSLARKLLGNASARMVYDFSSQPTVVASIAREQHAAVNPGNSPLQISFEYSDGMGNVAMQKVQAEPGLVKLPDGTSLDTGTQLRWIGNGRTVLNNKGNPIRQYEPYFSTTPAYETDPAWVKRGVSPVLYYDGAGRNIKTELPDGTFTKVLFDAWKQLQYDVNDTVLDSEWYRRRIDLPASDSSRKAARQSEMHADTPSCMITDTLGRPALGIDHNRWIQVVDNNRVQRDEQYYTYSELDIEGNPQRLIDARGNAVMEWRYDMLGHQVMQTSMDAGKRWMLNNALGNPVKTWDERGHEYAHAYDKLHRPLSTILTKDGKAYTIGKIKYGEGEANDKDRNLRGQVIEVYDESGRTETPEFDFKGNPKQVKRQLAAQYELEILDWDDTATTLMTEVFIQSTEFDALGRMTSMKNFHREDTTAAIYTPQYNARGILQSETLSVRGVEKKAIRNIQYDEKGQRSRIRYDNETTTRYQYDPLTFRLQQLRTTRHNYDPVFPDHRSGLTDNQVLQQLHYTYDPTGNITEIYDEAYEPVFFSKQRMEPKSAYLYDALYRLIEASGRENNAAIQAPKGFGAVETMPEIGFPIDVQAIRNYTQRYEYDPAGNFVQMQHLASGGNWTRTYKTVADSNRLWKTECNAPVETVTYDYDIHGNMLNFSNNAQQHAWDYRDMIQHLDLGGGGHAWYQYDSSKQRSRKRIQKGNIIEERIYLGGYELYRRWRNGNDAPEEEIETHHLFVDDQRVVMAEDVLMTNDDRLRTGVLYRYQYGNHLGSVGLECDDAGQIISYEEYHPYGTTAYQASSTLITPAAKRYRYTGMERDEESGLAYHTARYYLPWLGRWGSCDPIGVEGGGNLYGYCESDPIKNVDKTGTDISDWAGILSEPVVIQGARLGDTEGAYYDKINNGEFKIVSGEGIRPDGYFFRDKSQPYNKDWTPFEDYGRWKALQDSFKEVASFSPSRKEEWDKNFRLVKNAGTFVEGMAISTAVVLTGGAIIIEGGSLMLSTRAIQAGIAINSNTPLIIGGTIAYGAIMPEGSPNLMGPGDDLGSGAKYLTASADELSSALTKSDLYGPYRHWLTKGGLDDIVENGRLLSGEAKIIAGGGTRVRASIADDLVQGESTGIEFFTKTKPDWNNKPRGWVGWTMPEGEYLKIHITTIYMTVSE